MGVGDIISVTVMRHLIFALLDRAASEASVTDWSVVDESDMQSDMHFCMCC